MDIGSIYGSYSPSTAGRTAGTRSSQSGNSFSKSVTDMVTNRTNAYINSSRPKLTAGEIRELERKYDFRNMTQETYDAFLDEMVDKGVLTRAETEYFGYGGTVRLDPADDRVGVIRLEGLSEKYGQNTPFLANGMPGSGNMVAWLAQMIPGVDLPFGDGGQTANARAGQRMEMYGALIDVVFRATGTPYTVGRNVPGTFGGSDEGIDIIDQIRDPNSDFYRDMYNRMRVQMEESEEEKEKQAIIDALDAILESLSAKKDDWRKKPDSVRSMTELARTIDSLDKDDPRKEELNLLRERLQNLGIYVDLDAGVKDKDKWGETLTQSLIREETQESEPSILDII